MPPKLVGLPSNRGDFSGPKAYLGQSQYFEQQISIAAKTGLQSTYRLVAGIAALFPKRFLEQVDVPSMPRQEVATVVDRECLLNVRDHKIVKLMDELSVNFGGDNIIADVN